MARRRTQQVIKGYRDGGAVMAADVLDAAPAAEVPPSPPPELAEPEQTPAETAAAEREAREESERRVMEALAAQRQAEELSRLPPAERQLREMGMSMAEASFTLAHPEAIQPENLPVVAKAYRDGQRIGLRRDSHELFSLVLLALEQKRETDQGADRLDREVGRHRMIEAANATSSIPARSSAADVEQHAVRPAAERSPPAIPPPRKSMPMTAPVSRNEVPNMSGRPRENNTLTAAEREIAHTLPAPGMSNTEKEWTYLQNKKKLAAMRASGEYDDTQGRR